MKIVQIVPGLADTFYCDNCLRDTGLIRALQRSGHDALIVPLYLPLSSHEHQTARKTPIFFGGINVYLQQKFFLFRKTPRWLDRLFDSPKLLNWLARHSSLTDARDLGETTLSMLRGRHGRQAKELDKLIDWLAARESMDIVCLSNALLMGLTREIKTRLNVPIVCSLEDEDEFVDSLPDPYRQEAWRVLIEDAADVDGFIAVSRYYADWMCDRLHLRSDRVHVVPIGLDPAGYRPAELPPDPPVIGFLSRLCRDKGLDILIDAFMLLKADARFRTLKLRAAGGHLPADKGFLDQLTERLAREGLEGDVEFLPNLDRTGVQAFLRTLSVLSVPARHGEAFGFYILEALASAVPVVQPRHGAFPELLEATGGGLLCEPNDPTSLAEAMKILLLDSQKRRELAERGRKAVLEQFNIERMVHKSVQIYEQVLRGAR
jgi:glycosyltransferase involved in cell wall biosynthesis